MDLLLNRKLLYVMAVTYDENRFLAVESAEPPLERVDLHGGDDHDEMTYVALRRSCQERSTNRLDDFLQSGAHLPVQAHLIAGWKKILSNLECGNEADTVLKLV